MRRASPTHRERDTPATVITLTTDFGTADPWAGVMKGVILGIAPGARIVDLTHEVPPRAVLAGALLLRTAVPYFPPGTIHVAVVDPGVGTRRRALLVETDTAFLIGPDNGVLSLAAPTRAVRRVRDVSRSRYRRQPVSHTFHGRDVFAPVAAHLAAGVPARLLGRDVEGMVRLHPPVARRRGRTLTGEVLWVDRFGNLITNVAVADLAAGGFRGRDVSVTIADRAAPLRRAYGSMLPGKVLALINSSGLLEIAVNQGSAAAALGVGAGMPLRVQRR